MRTDYGNFVRMMVVGATVLLVCVCVGLAEEKKPADPFVKGSKPAVAAEEAKSGEGDSISHAADGAGLNDLNDTDERMRLVDVEVQFVAFELTDVEKLVATDRLNVDSLMTLWANGGGHLLAAPRILTGSGQEATVKGVTECIYPKEFAGSTGETTGTNESATTMSTQVARGPVAIPGSFETREVGAIINVVPEIIEGDSMIHLTLAPRVVEEPIWRDYGSKYLGSNGKEQQTRMEQPFFQTYSLNCVVSVVNGRRTLIGGGMPSRDRKQVVYVFVTARKVGAVEKK